jgi:hypothetical protein
MMLVVLRRAPSLEASRLVLLKDFAKGENPPGTQTKKGTKAKARWSLDFRGFFVFSLWLEKKG